MGVTGSRAGVGECSFSSPRSPCTCPWSLLVVREWESLLWSALSSVRTVLNCDIAELFAGQRPQDAEPTRNRHPAPSTAQSGCCAHLRTGAALCCHRTRATIWGTG